MTKIIKNQSLREFENCLINEAYSPETIKSYTNNVKMFMEFKDGVSFTREDILGYKNYMRDELSYNAKTINHKLSSLKRYNEFLLEQNKIDNMIIGKKDMCKINTEMINPTEISSKDVNDFLNSVINEDNYAAYRNYTIVMLLSYTGIRISECVNLTIDDINLKKDEILVRNGKGNKQRVSYINKKLHDILSNYLKNDRYDQEKYGKYVESDSLFISRQSYQIRRSTVNTVFYTNRKSEAMHPHALRHYFCANALEHGFDIHEVAYLAGHRSINTTAKYLNPTKKTMKEKNNKMQFTYPNQKIVVIKKKDISAPGSIFGVFEKEASLKAMKELTYLELELYMYLGFNQSGYELALSPQDISEEIGCNKRAMQQAVSSLIERGYLIQDPDQKNRYTYVQIVDNDVPCKEAMAK